VTVLAPDKLVVQDWKRWGDLWAMFTRCNGCREMKHCRGHRRAWMLCLDCFVAGKR